MKDKNTEAVSFRLSRFPHRLFLFVASYDEYPRVEAMLLTREDSDPADLWDRIRGVPVYDDGRHWIGGPQILAWEAVDAANEYEDG